MCKEERAIDKFRQRNSQNNPQNDKISSNNRRQTNIQKRSSKIKKQKKRKCEKIVESPQKCSKIMNRDLLSQSVTQFKKNQYASLSSTIKNTSKEPVFKFSSTQKIQSHSLQKIPANATNLQSKSGKDEILAMVTKILNELKHLNLIFSSTNFVRNSLFENRVIYQTKKNSN